MVTALSNVGLTRRQQIAAVVLVALAVGLWTAPHAADRVGGPDGTVAVVSVEGSIHSGMAEDVEDELREVRQNESIDAVVLQVDSPGGTPAGSEQIYTSAKRTGEEKPLVASVHDMGASGGYYAMLPAEEIYVLPTSTVGSVGVAGVGPSPTAPNPGNSAPDKGAAHPDDDREQQELLKETFLNSVMEERGDRIELDREEVAHARVYQGTEAVENGFADEIGSTEDAVHDAAQRAGLDSYEVVERDVGTADGLLLLEADDDGDTVVVVEESPFGYDGVDTHQYLYIVGDVQTEHEAVDAIEISDGDGVADASADEIGGEKP